jgi:hypothetical protein
MSCSPVTAYKASATVTLISHLHLAVKEAFTNIVLSPFHRHRLKLSRIYFLQVLPPLFISEHFNKERLMSSNPRYTEPMVYKSYHASYMGHETDSVYKYFHYIKYVLKICRCSLML